MSKTHQMGAGANTDAQLFEQLAREGVFEAFAAIDFAAREFPQSRKRRIADSFGDQDMVIVSPEYTGYDVEETHARQWS